MKHVRRNPFFQGLFLLLLFPFAVRAFEPGAHRDIYQIKIYQIKDKGQEDALDSFLENAYLPALHRAGIEKAGVFKPIGNDTAALRRIYLLIPLHSMEQLIQLNEDLEKDELYKNAGRNYLEAPYNSPPYLRTESILLQAFVEMPHFAAPQLNGPKNERIYELRSYESPTEKYHVNKVQMFNQGNEVGLFKRLGFNAVFYAAVLSGAHMPNLMYMTSFDNMSTHEEHWKNFVSAPEWKKLSSMPEYQNNVSHIDIVLLHPTSYSDL